MHTRHVSTDKFEIRCEECDSELIVNTGTCPICGNEIPVKGRASIDEKESDMMDKIRTAYNLVFCAEYLNIGTQKANELIAQARQELDVGDFEEAEEALSKAFDEILPPLKEELKKELSEAYKLLRKKEVSGTDISEFSRDLLRKANAALDAGELDKTLVLVENFHSNIE